MDLRIRLKGEGFGFGFKVSVNVSEILPRPIMASLPLLV